MSIDELTKATYKKFLNDERFNSDDSRDWPTSQVAVRLGIIAGLRLAAEQVRGQMNEMDAIDAILALIPKEASDGK